MKNIKLNKGFFVASFIIAIFVFQSMADTPQENYYILGGAYSFTVSTGPGNYINNPNNFGVCMVKSIINGTWKYWGFLLDGSKVSESWLKMLQDAAVNKRMIEIYTDDNSNNGYGLHLTNSYFATGKLIYVGIYNNQ